MQTFISKYGLAAHLALLAVTPLILSPFCEAATIAVSLLWLSALTAIWLVMEPSRRANERLHEARLRVRRAIVRDPLFWLMLLTSIFAGIRALNGGIARVYDFSAHKWFVEGPSNAFFPGHVAGAGFLPFATVIALLVLLQGCRHALGKSARVATASMISIFAGGGVFAALLAVCMSGTGAMGLAGFVDGAWAMPVSAAQWVSSSGTACGLCLLASIVGTAGLFECQWNKLLLLFAFGMGLCATGLFYFSTPLEFAAFVVLAVLALCGCAVYLVATMRVSVVMRFGVTVFIALTVPFVIAVSLAPAEMTALHAEVFGGLGALPGSLFPEGFAARRAALSDFAAMFWKESLWLGRGLGSFSLLLWQAGGETQGLVSAGPLNGWLLLLAERGILGAMTFALPLAFLLFSFVVRLIGALGRHVFLPLVALGFLALFAVIGLSFVSCACVRSDVLLLLGVFLALSGSSFPARRKRESEDEGVS